MVTPTSSKSAFLIDVDCDYSYPAGGVPLHDGMMLKIEAGNSL